MLEERSFTHQTLSWGETYQFNHSRRGKVIARLIAEDQEWYFVELTRELETATGYIKTGERFPIRKSLVFSVELSC